MSRADFENYIKFYRLEKENCFFFKKILRKNDVNSDESRKKKSQSCQYCFDVLEKIKKMNTFLNHNEKGRQVVF